MIAPLMLADWFSGILTFLFLVVGTLLILVILVQKGRGGGLVAAFSGLGTQALGNKAGDVMTWITVGFAGVFLLLAMLLTRSVARENMDRPPTPMERSASAPPAGTDAPATSEAPAKTGEAK